MPITFHTTSYADLTFLTDIGKQLITSMGHTPNVPGAVLSSDLPAAITHLRAAIAESVTHPPQAQDPADDHEPRVSLSQRASPLLALLEAAQLDKENVMWD